MIDHISVGVSDLDCSARFYEATLATLGLTRLVTRPATVGARGRLSFTIGGNPLAAEVEIRRVVAAPDRAGFNIGARFVDITQAQRDAIERFARP